MKYSEICTHQAQRETANRQSFTFYGNQPEINQTITVGRLVAGEIAVALTIQRDPNNTDLFTATIPEDFVPDPIDSYPGLQPLDRDARTIHFGRDHEINQLLLIPTVSNGAFYTPDYSMPGLTHNIETRQQYGSIHTTPTHGISIEMPQEAPTEPHDLNVLMISPPSRR